ncbi:MAG TPA: prohead protease/major capsid protein fusion protein [Bryobacteraceae bacterium]|jgi:hypothetical protein
MRKKTPPGKTEQVEQAEQREIEWLHAEITPATLDELAASGAAGDSGYTANINWYTGTAVERYDWRTGERYDLTLSMDPAHCDMSRLASGGAPFLNNHSSYDLSDVIGVIQSAALNGGKGTAQVRFSKRPEVDPIRNDVNDGILRNVSVGASIRKLKNITPKDAPEGTKKSYLAIDWQPMEVSAVPIGADAGAGFLSHQVIEAQLEERATAHEELHMDETQQAAATAAANEAALAAARTEALAAERARVASLNAAFLPMVARLGADFLPGVIANGNTVEQARAAAFDKLAATTATDPTQGHVAVGQDASTKMALAVENCILHRVNPGPNKLDTGRDFRGMSLLEIGRTLLERDGVKCAGMSKTELAGRILKGSRPNGDFVEFAGSGYSSAADFPSILANVMNKTLRGAYDAEPQTFKAFTKRGTLSDFKPGSRTQIGDVQTLQPIGENGEFKRSSVSDSKETIQLGTYGEIFALGRVAMINDDLGAFNRLAESHGRAAARLESDLVWAIITNGTSTSAPYVMNDTHALFDATNHVNYTSSGTAISVAALGVMTTAMRKQKGLNSIGFLNLQPKYLLVPVALDAIAKQYVAATTIVYTKPSDFNPYNGTMQVISEPRLDAASSTAWYASADPGQIDTIEYDYLEGQEGVYMETRNGFEIDGMEIKARLDFGCKTIDYRGLYRNAGA